MDEKSCCDKFSVKKFASLFKALGDSTRLAIFSHLCVCHKSGDGQGNVKDVSQCCEVDMSVVSRHLSTMKKADLLLAEKKGKEVFYSINSKELASKLRELADFIEGDNHE
ncbi:MAG: winged helix-turn-helix transcriptional regulator [Bacteriovoracaceae bacterium]|jgi:ArsR family transcriptional regulator, arsenate/arsenite/antimonite-responsive transcriptional repressor|nr:winged helix-turn-helix transcriptional regulator [Bacteriovoracaceae bacterium]